MPPLRVGLCPSLTKEVLEALNSAGVKTVVDFVCCNPESLAQKSSISYKVLLSIRKLLLAQYSAFPINGTDLYDDVIRKAAILPTGSDSLDNLLDGGVYTSEVTEIVGATATGKTQFCLTLASSVAMTTRQNVLYIDSNGSFSAERVEDIMRERQLSDKGKASAFSKIRCSLAFDIFEVIKCLEETRTAVVSGSDSFYVSLKLIILDSVAAVVSPILGGLQTDGHSLMTHLGRILLTLSADHALAIVVTNGVVQSDGGGTKPALGKYWVTVPHTRVMFHENIASLVKSGKQPLYSTSEFTITDGGVTDVR
ncbi:DNA repair protein RAD51 homolog 4-like [Ptychodera flava]|uniref:DNA repair protein RAD51 homolog 4-like n=1 Tax=Ptychodera flava TaxID=63121 RepID=UPI003969F57E